MLTDFQNSFTDRFTNKFKGSVATGLRYGGIFNKDFIANLRMGLSMKEL